MSSGGSGPALDERGQGRLDEQSLPREEPGRYGRSVSCYFSPVIGTKGDYEELFRSENIKSCVEVGFRNKMGFVRFATQAEADIFVERFDGYVFRGQKIRVEKTRQTSYRSKAVQISGFAPGSVTERDAYGAFLPFGFIRRVSVNPDFGVVEFDTQEEAQNVLKQYRTIEVHGQILTVGPALIRDDDKQNLTIPLKELIPLDHPFWYRVQDMMWE
jgi:RNA recognition motif-containing protein